MTVATKTDPIRLACESCDTDVGDGLESLGEAAVLGWTGILWEQSYADSIAPREQTGNFDWWTHIGLCPECRKQEG